MRRSTQILLGAVSILAFVLIIWAMSADSPYMGVADNTEPDNNRARVIQIETEAGMNEPATTLGDEEQELDEDLQPYTPE